MRRTLPILFSALLGACAGTRPAQEVEWFESGIYGGITYGVSHLDATGSDVDRELAKRGYTTSTELDARDVAAGIYAGYRFEIPLGIELAWVNLGSVESFVSAMPPDLDAFLDDVGEVHPVLGEGLQLQGRWFAWEREGFELSLAAGVWVWDVDLDVRAATGEVQAEGPDDLDPTFGVAGTYDLGRRIKVRAGWDRYWLDGDTADALTVGLEIGIPFMRRSRSDDFLAML